MLISMLALIKRGRMPARPTSTGDRVGSIAAPISGSCKVAGSGGVRGACKSSLTDVGSDSDEQLLSKEMPTHTAMNDLTASVFSAAFLMLYSLIPFILMSIGEI